VRPTPPLDNPSGVRPQRGPAPSLSALLHNTYGSAR